MKKLIISSVVALVVGMILGATIASTTKAPETSSFGGLVNTNTTQFAAGFTAGTANQFRVTSAGIMSSSGGVVASSSVIGTNGTSITKVIEGTFTNTSCTGPATQGAFATSTYSCTVTGAAANDRVFVTLASTTNVAVLLQAAYASTTASNNIRVVMYNASTTAGAATTTGAFYRVSR